ncbi:MAG TPA: CBS domain-containing protein [Pseudonocardiaceae bacterium]|nr:CBS domain-containing protein [Pseudonocardiaceae bacterium]
MAEEPDGGSGLTAERLMGSAAVVVEPGTEVVTALRVMDDRRLQHLPVVHDGRCLGLAFQVDLLAALARAQFSSLPLLVGSICRQPPPAVLRDTTRRVVAQIMVNRESDALVVLDGGHVLGVVTALDVVRSVALYG